MLSVRRFKCLCLNGSFQGGQPTIGFSVHSPTPLAKRLRSGPTTVYAAQQRRSHSHGSFRERRFISQSSSMSKAGMVTSISASMSMPGYHSSPFQALLTCSGNGAMEQSTTNPPNHVLRRTGTASLRVAVYRPLSLLSLGGVRLKW